MYKISFVYFDFIWVYKNEWIKKLGMIAQLSKDSELSKY